MVTPFNWAIQKALRHWVPLCGTPVCRCRGPFGSSGHSGLSQPRHGQAPCPSFLVRSPSPHPPKLAFCSSRLLGEGMRLPSASCLYFTDSVSEGWQRAFCSRKGKGEVWLQAYEDGIRSFPADVLNEPSTDVRLPLVLERLPVCLCWGLGGMFGCRQCF